ncbi:DUF4124 domain-containing protein [Nocardioides plantarum]|uniref:DUF4124 domain-containing protein n=1 Tax=Nocardioides plantarum TaxID=29299 RepID=A0ABV5KAZ9_9ACTN|nr:DUF4124 domain-containing protein [Nocardioides plantarum]
MKTTTTFLAALLATGLLVSSVPAAHAQTWRHTDATGDVVAQDQTDDGVAEPRVVRGVKQADVVRLTVQHGADVLQVATTLRAFGGPDNSWDLRVVTSHGDTYDFQRCEYSSDGTKSTSSRRNGYRYQCDGLRISRTSAGIVARVPVACLDIPYRLRVGVQARVIYPLVADPRDRIAQDDALRTGKVTARKPRLSPWIVRDSSAR